MISHLFKHSACRILKLEKTYRFCRVLANHLRLISISSGHTLRNNHTSKLTELQGKFLKHHQLTMMKLDTPQFHTLFTPELNKLITLFEQYKYELRIAGGAVRDLLMDNVPHDVDFATTATPDEMQKMFEKEQIRMINTKGETHGTVTCRINDKENFEVTTLRIDVTTDGRHAEVEFTKDWQLDALRRDLTINSMFLGFDGTVYDHFNGKDDLDRKKIRFVGDAEARIQEDYLRILRYFRFYGRIAPNADDHEHETLKAIKGNMHGLAGISGERIWVELKKIFIGNHAGSLVKLMMELGMAKYVGLPEKANTAEFKKVYERCEDLDPQPMTVLPALMEGEEDVYKFHERVKMSRDEQRLGLFIIQHRGDDFGSDPFHHCQDLLCDTAGKEPRTQDRICELLKYLDNREVLKRFKAYTPPKFPITGYQLIEKGVPKGPIFAKILAALRDIWKKSNYTLSAEELMDYVEELKDKFT